MAEEKDSGKIKIKINKNMLITGGIILAFIAGIMLTPIVRKIGYRIERIKTEARLNRLYATEKEREVRVRKLLKQWNEETDEKAVQLVKLGVSRYCDKMGVKLQDVMIEENSITLTFEDPSPKPKDPLEITDTCKTMLIAGGGFIHDSDLKDRVYNVQLVAKCSDGGIHRLRAKVADIMATEPKDLDK